MALQMNYYYAPVQIMIFNAYWRINPKNGLIGGKNEINYIIEVFKNADASHVENAQAIDRLTYSFIPNISNGAPNFIVQAYNHAKTLSNFEGSVDV
jgi:hypothetical protein